MGTVIDMLLRIHDADVLLWHDLSAPGDPSVSVLFGHGEVIMDLHPQTLRSTASALADTLGLHEARERIFDGLTDLWRQRELALTEAVREANRA